MTFPKSPEDAREERERAKAAEAEARRRSVSPYLSTCWLVGIPDLDKMGRPTGETTVVEPWQLVRLAEDDAKAFGSAITTARPRFVVKSRVALMMNMGITIAEPGSCIAPSVLSDEQAETLLEGGAIARLEDA